MDHRRTLTRLLPFMLLLAALVLLFAGCSSEDFSSPQNTFAPGGEVAEQQKNDFLLVMWPALVIMILVMGGVVAIGIKFRHKKGDPLPKQVHGNTPMELGWTIAPALLLAVIAVPTVTGIRELARDPADDALLVHVTGVQWAWQFEYTELNDAGGQPLFFIEELRIPVGREIGVTIDSGDVNHSFWVPKLAGKTDAIANHTNRMWLKADKAGTYLGQCAEFCGVGHSGMRLTVIAMPEDEFQAWVREQQASPPGGPPPGGAPPPEPPEGGADATPASDDGTPAAEPTTPADGGATQPEPTASGE